MITYTDVVRERVEAPLEAVWKILADFGGIGRYVKGADVSHLEGPQQGVGCVRVIPRGDQATRERMETYDAAGHAYSYAVLEGSPVAMEGYVGEVKVVPLDGNACMVEWGGRFETASAPDPGAQKKGLEKFYRNAIDGVRTLVA